MITRLVAVVLSIITARMLDPAQVGLLGLAAIIVGVISIVGYYAEIAAVAQPRELQDERVALGASVVRLSIVALLLVLIAAAFPMFGPRIAGDGAGVAQLRDIVTVFSLTVLSEVLSGYPSIILQRRLDLTALAMIQPVQPIVALGTATYLLVRGSGAVGVAWGNVLGSASVCVILWIRLLAKGIRWYGLPSLATIRDTLRRSGAMFVGLFGGFLAERFDNLLVSLAIGPRLMSYYSIAWNASHTPANVFSRAMSFVLIPTLAHLKDEPERVERALRDCLRYSYVLLAPVCAFFFVAAPDVLTLILGPRWLPAAVPLRIMAISVLTAPILFACTALLVGTGRAQWTGISTTIHLVALALVIPPLARLDGVRGAAYGQLATVCLLTLTVLSTARLITKRINSATLAAPLLPVACAFSAAALAWLAGRYLDGFLVRFVAVGALLVGIYYVLLFAFARQTHLGGLTDLFYAVIFRRPRPAKPVNG